MRHSTIICQKTNLSVGVEYSIIQRSSYCVDKLYVRLTMFLRPIVSSNWLTGRKIIPVLVSTITSAVAILCLPFTVIVLYSLSNIVMLCLPRYCHRFILSYCMKFLITLYTIISWIWITSHKMVCIRISVLSQLYDFNKGILYYKSSCVTINVNKKD